MKNKKTTHSGYKVFFLGLFFMTYGSSGYCSLDIFLPTTELRAQGHALFQETNISYDTNQSTDSIPDLLRRNKLTVTLNEPLTSSILPDKRSGQRPYECKVVFEGRDSATGDRKKELSYEPLLSYTASHIKPYLPGKDLLYADSKMFRFNGGYTYLAVRFCWNARNPQSSYGRLRSSGAIRFYLSDSKSVTLYNNYESNWVLDKETKTYELQSLFLLHPRQIKLLRNQPVLKAIVYWERGFEEYPIYPITIFMNQLKCLE